MKTLAIMQNQWLLRPEDHEAALADVEARRGKEGMEEFRLRFIHRALFAGCLSGRVLKKHLGKVTDEIIWEQASRTITSKPSDCPPADFDHIRAILARYKPGVVITFGKVAGEAMEYIVAADGILKSQIGQIIQSPHPAARGAGMQESVREACVALLNAMGRY